MSLVARLVLAALLSFFAFFGAVQSLAPPRCVTSSSRRSSGVVAGSGRAAAVAFEPGATDTTTTQKQQQPQHLFKRGSGTEDSAAWYDHVVKQGVTLALPTIVMLSVVTTPIMVINPQPVQAAAAAATKEDITMLSDKIDAQKTETKNMFDAQKTETKNMFDAQSNKIDAQTNKYSLAPIATTGFAGLLNYLTILEVKKDTKVVAKQVLVDEGAKILLIGTVGAFILALSFGLLTVKIG
jgi:hypothetical protein